MVETRAMAEALGVDTATAEAVNVFPEMFHCSGFALFGKATRWAKWADAVRVTGTACPWPRSCAGPWKNVGHWTM